MVSHSSFSLLSPQCQELVLAFSFVVSIFDSAAFRIDAPRHATPRFLSPGIARQAFSPPPFLLLRFRSSFADSSFSEEISAFAFWLSPAEDIIEIFQPYITQDGLSAVASHQQLPLNRGGTLGRGNRGTAYFSWQQCRNAFQNVASLTYCTE